MIRRNKTAKRRAGQAYLISFGDTMTTLLAFFIVLNSLARDQTGADLYDGTGSFVRAFNTSGMQGPFSGRRSQSAIEHEAPNPSYLPTGDEDSNQNQHMRGPDPEDDQLRVIDREAEAFQRFVNEFERFFPSQSSPEARGEVVFDLFAPLAPDPPYLRQTHHQVLEQVLPALHHPEYRVQVIVWATTPGPTAWTRAAGQAQEVVVHIAQLGELGPSQRARLHGVGRAWIDSQAKRPVISFVVQKRDGSRLAEEIQ